MSEVKREHLAGLELALDIVAGHIVQDDAANDLRKMIAQASAAPEQEPVAFRCKLSIHKQWKYIDHRAPDSFELRELQIENLYTHADTSDVQRLRAELDNQRANTLAQIDAHAETREQLFAATQRADAAERNAADLDALLREVQKDSGFRNLYEQLQDQIDALLSASAEPANCMPCGGWGVIAAEPGDAETKCEHCNGTGKEPAKGGDGEVV